MLVFRTYKIISKRCEQLFINCVDGKYEEKRVWMNEVSKNENIDTHSPQELEMKDTKWNNKEKQR